MTSFERAILSPAATTPSLSVSASPDQLPVLRSLIWTVAAPLCTLAEQVVRPGPRGRRSCNHSHLPCSPLQHLDVHIRRKRRHCAGNPLDDNDGSDHHEHLVLHMARP